jgi:phosphoenolpyruvate synthase/pyruvate phosphate dikinase
MNRQRIQTVRKLIPAVIAAFMLTASSAAEDERRQLHPDIRKELKELGINISKHVRRPTHQECVVAKGDISIGMSKQQVLASCWGKPDRINTSETAAGLDEQWSYGPAIGYVYFRHDVVVAIQRRH